MKVIEYLDHPGSYFVAMEYYRLILNRTFLVLLTKSGLLGLKVNGIVSIEGGLYPISRAINGKLAVKGDLTNPLMYIGKRHFEKISEYDDINPELLISNSANFFFTWKTIEKAVYDPKKKWGMAYYPHDGKVYVHTTDDKRKELIILGNQSGQNIANSINCRGV